MSGVLASPGLRERLCTIAPLLVTVSTTFPAEAWIMDGLIANSEGSTAIGADAPESECSADAPTMIAAAPPTAMKRKHVRLTKMASDEKNERCSAGRGEVMRWLLRVRYRSDDAARSEAARCGSSICPQLEDATGAGDLAGRDLRPFRSPRSRCCIDGMRRSSLHAG